ncbi:hypothetical protein BH09PSE2_BH09PSE2_08060 [soil metagenome]
MRLSRSTTPLALVDFALAVSACHPAPLGKGRNHSDKPVSVGARLACPEHEGSLNRVEVAADGRSCRYTDAEGREAHLSLLDLNGRDAQTALAEPENELKALVPAAVPGSEVATAADLANATDEGEHVKIDLPGIHIDTQGRDGAHIRAFGQDIDAKGKGAVIHGGWNGKTAVINAHDNGVEIKGGFFGKASIDANYLLASETAGPQGHHAAGYVARGPVAGPLVLGVETSKSSDDEDHHGNDRYRDLRRLVDRNVSSR